MFGGLAFLIDGKMAVSASSKGGLLLRINPTLTESLVTDDELRHWVSHGVTYVRSLPPKHAR